MPSGEPRKVRPLSDYGGPGRSAVPEQPTRSATVAAGTIAKQAPKAAAKGAVKGAAEGALLGPEGAAAGAVEGASKGAAKGAKKSIMLGGGRKSGTVRFGSQHLLVAEFLTCFLVLALSPLAKDVKASDWMKKSTAVCLLFLILSMIGAAGPKSRQAATGLGALVTLAVLLDQRSIFSLLINKFNGGQANAAVAAGNASAAAGGAPQVIRTPQGPQTITVVPGPNGSWVAGNSADF